ncbi:MAG: DNA-protecting protein DprA [Candidatus Vogelbacteria bacterium CG22_combo_CG10-13_8_21_14_all_37_9]|uniref:DNA-protecting protein DprA n=1 Tax=Candidatus Vogelbacteria bacterium CG22_combo_CG10-13_8_21_14_all_37_9 TaxID=1975046 RepID=A0A2H0BL55_9BACT|nr:MAG: DNA-protecting protein DprA [Candidatus Vogelbacteria bacterium CG22_combo_CG10-13_8_21_14_all_37_9]
MPKIFQKLTGLAIPEPLREIPEPPQTLFYQGQIFKTDENFLTVVGSRRMSHYGREVCEKLIAGLQNYPITIVSGLALGIDTVAHQSALRAKLRTIAFPGSGLDQSVLYPRSNLKLAEEIIETGGLLISELAPTQKATPYTFPRRNRLMAGLSKATLIIEASQKSGTLITARLALDYNREVLAVPGAITWPNSFGPNYLIREGAIPITSSVDILQVFGFEPENSDQQLKLIPEDLSTDELKILKLIQAGETNIDQMIIDSKLSAPVVNTILMLLEIKGLISNKNGIISLT